VCERERKTVIIANSTLYMSDSNTDTVESDLKLQFVALQNVVDLQCFKVVGDEPNVFDYVVAHPKGRNNSDWSAFYLQFNAAHALGTLGYRYDQSYGVASLFSLKLSLPINTKMVLIDDNMMCKL
jgi:hypothetical protein